MPQDVNIDKKFIRPLYEKLKSAASTEKDVREKALDELEEKNPYFSRYVFQEL